MEHTVDKTDIKDKYISDFKTFIQNLNGNSNNIINQLRKPAIEKFSGLGFPNVKNEAWKYTSLKAVVKGNYKLFKKENIRSISSADVKDQLENEIETNRLVFINGRFSEKFSHISEDDKNVIISSLYNVSIEHNQILKDYLNQLAEKNDHALPALNTAFFEDGTLIYLKKDQIIKNPVLISHIIDSTNESWSVHARTLIIAEPNSRAKIIETHKTIGDKKGFFNYVSEIYLKEGADINYHKVQNDLAQTSHIHTHYIHQLSNSCFTSNISTFDGELVRNELHIMINGKACNTNLYGLYILNGKSHVDNHTLIVHASAESESNQLYKGIMGDQSTGIFDGKIIVQPHAQKTNAFQLSKNVLTSDSANAYNKPQLEIFADDVKCSHGATTGQLNESAVFYMQSRGIPEKEAKALLLKAFASDVVEKIQIEALKNQLNQILTDRLLS